MRLPLVTLGAVALFGCSAEKPLPVLAAGLPSDLHQAEQTFNARVKTRFPAGTPDRVIRSDLAAQGFKVDGENGELLRDNIPCRTVWSVRWKAARGIIREAWGVYGFQCP